MSNSAAITDTAIATAASAPTSAAAGSIVALDRVSKTYGGGVGQVIALRELSLRLAPARMVALVGRSGSGKSTLLNILGAVDRATTGSVTVSGTEISKLSEERLALFRRRSLGYVFQSFHLLPSLTAFDNIAIPWLLDGALTKERGSEIHALLARLGLADKARRYPDELSGGQQQRIALARAVIHRPRLVLADEPTGNLDARGGREILELLAELQRDFGITIVMATHSTEAAAYCQDRITLADGRVIDVHGEIDCALAPAAEDQT